MISPLRRDGSTGSVYGYRAVAYNIPRAAKRLHAGAHVCARSATTADRATNR